MTDKPIILVTNDDGITAPGIRELYEALSVRATLYVVAPASQRSGASLGFTCQKAVSVEEVDTFPLARAWAVDGTPADCIKMALSVLNITPDLIVSGINHGSNAGRNLLYSGTVGGVMEGALRGIPGMAFSFMHLCDASFHDMKMFIPGLVQRALDYPVPKGTFFNVNFPHHPHTEIKGVRLASQGSSYYLENPREHVPGSYFLGGRYVEHDESETSDTALLGQGYIAVVPVNVHDVTDHGVLASHSEHFNAASQHMYEGV